MKKKRPCLRCDRLFLTSPQIRICVWCKNTVYDPEEGHNAHEDKVDATYAGYQAASRGLNYYRKGQE